MEWNENCARGGPLGNVVKQFGTTAKGEDVHAITLSGFGLSATVLTLGAILQDVRLDGVDYGLTLGSDSVTDYEGGMQFNGSVVGPVANRLSAAQALIGGKMHPFEANQDGRITLHGGSAGIHKFVWKIDASDDNYVILHHKMPHGQGGFPGNRMVTARFDILDAPALRLTLTTTTDALTIANVTNHSYWNLDGLRNVKGHRMRVSAETYLPVDADGLVTGDICGVNGTGYDFRKSKPLLPDAPPLNNTFCVATCRRDLTPCFWAEGASGVQLAIATTEPGVHVYDAVHAGHTGFAVEAQMWPDAPNRPGFPSIEITPDAPAVQVTEWRFSKP